MITIMLVAMYAVPCDFHKLISYVVFTGCGRGRAWGEELGLLDVINLKIN